jgi:hypothetical protein
MCLARGQASPNCVDTNGLPLLATALFDSDTSIAKLLCSQGADISSVTIDGIPAWVTAIPSSFGFYIEGFGAAKFNFDNQDFFFSSMNGLDTEDFSIAIDNVIQALSQSRTDYLDYLSNATYLGRRWAENLACADVDLVVRAIQFFQLKGNVDGWDLLMHFDPIDWTKSPRTMSKILRFCFSAGLDPDFCKGRRQRPLLVDALGGVAWLKENSVSVDKQEVDEQEVDEQQFDDTVPIWILVCTVIQAGADIYHIKELENGDLCTPTGLAWFWHVEAEWENALEAAGYDPQDVYDEDFRRLREFERLRGAKRTAVDTEELATPSLAGLQRRRPRQAEDD